MVSKHGNTYSKAIIELIRLNPVVLLIYNYSTIDNI